MGIKPARNGRRGLVIIAALAMMAATLASSVGVPAASAHGLQGGPLTAGSPMTLSGAPAALQAAVGRTLGRRSASLAASPKRTKLTASDGATDDQFGHSVAVSDSTAVVGAHGHNSATGAAYVFVRSGTTWSQQAELTASDATAGDDFGWSVAVSGSTAVVGAQYRNAETGAAYVFVRSGATWSQQAQLTASDGATNAYFGFSVAVSGSTAVVGAYGHNSGTGAAYVFVNT
jgi:hypothetical protein